MPFSTTESFVQNATGATLTGGTSTAFVNDGTGTNGRKRLVDSTQADPNLRKSVTTYVRMGSPAATPGANQTNHRIEIVVKTPFLTASGRKSDETKSVTLNFHPERTSAQRVVDYWCFIGVLVQAAVVSTVQTLIHN